MECLNPNLSGPLRDTDNKVFNNDNVLSIYHQNIRGLRGKTDEIINSMYPHPPHILCLSEHHLEHVELCHTSIEYYNMGAEYCRKRMKQGGVCIFIHDSLSYQNVKLVAYCREHDLEACAVKLSILSDTIYVLVIYRAPNGDFTFL
jgi:hypothetical protein